MKSLRFLALAASLFVPATALAAPASDMAGRMASRVTDADSNRDGMITRAEMSTYRNSQFERIDRNGDGVLDNRDMPRLKRAAERIEEARKTFDSNGDGRVTRDEFASAPMPAFDHADLDGNGVLDPYELKKLKEKSRS